jgi:ELWxxDGT repeat protein
MHALDGKLYFRGTDGLEYELYVHDPAAGTTTAVADGYPTDMHALSGKLYFNGDFAT